MQIQWEREHGQLIALRIRESGFERQLNLIYHRRIKLPLVVQAFVEILRSA